MSYMIYCITQTPAPLTGAHLIWVTDGQLAALIEPIDGDYVRPSRRHVKAFQQTLETLLLAGHTLLPLRFGTLVEHEDDVRQRLLIREAATLRAWLDQLRDHHEASLRVTWPQPRLFEEARRYLSAPVIQPGASIASQLELGKAVADAIEAVHERTRQAILDRVTPVVQEIALDDPKDDLTSLQAALLLRRDQQAAFEEAVYACDAEFGGHLTFKLVSPLPVYSFAQLALSLSPA